MLLISNNIHKRTRKNYQFKITSNLIIHTVFFGFNLLLDAAVVFNGKDKRIIRCVECIGFNGILQNKIINSSVSPKGKGSLEISWTLKIISTLINKLLLNTNYKTYIFWLKMTKISIFMIQNFFKQLELAKKARIRKNG